MDELAASIARLISTPFDVTVRAPFRAELLAVGPTEHVLVVVVHHISADGFSMAPLARDVMFAYTARCRGEEPGWSPLVVQYADYALWQREVLGADDDETSLMSNQLRYWKSTLSGLPDVLELPIDRPRPAESSNRGGHVDFELDADVVAALSAVGRASNATLFMVIHAALAVLLGRLSGTSDIAVGTPVAGRGEQVLDDVVGMFVNTLVLRTEVEPDATYSDLLTAVRVIDLDAFDHAEVPFERVVEELNPTRSQSYSPLFQVSLAFENQETPTLELPDLTVSGVEFDTAVTQFDLDFVFVEPSRAAETASIAGRLVYSTDLFSDDTARRIVTGLTRVLDAIVEDAGVIVGDIELASAAERALLLETWNATDDRVPDTTLVEMFAEQVRRHPERTAVVFEDRTLTYGDFAAQVNRLARWLIRQGVGPESVVGLAAHRSIELVTAVYAVLTTGAAYVPLDPDDPEDRIQYIIDTAGPDLVLHDRDRPTRGRGLHRRTDRPAGRARPLGLLGLACPRCRSVGAAAWRQPCLCHLHLGIHRAAQGRGGESPGGGEPDGVDDFLLPAGRVRHGDSEDAHDVRCFGLDVWLAPVRWPARRGSSRRAPRPGLPDEPCRTVAGDHPGVGSLQVGIALFMSDSALNWPSFVALPGFRR